VIVTGDYLIDDRTIAALEALGARVEFKPLWVDQLVRIVNGLLSGGA
jgi:hypothetical protein